MAGIKAGILNSQTTPEPIELDSKIYGVDGLPTKSEHMPNLNIVRTDDAIGMTPADFHNVFPFNEIVNENVPSFVEYGQWDANYNTFEDQSQMVYELSKENNVFYEHLFMDKSPASHILGIATSATIYVKDPNNRYKYVVASGTKFDKPIDFENCVYQMDNMDAYLQELMEGMDTSYVYPVVRYGALFIMLLITGVTGYIYYDGEKWNRTEETVDFIQPLDETIPKQEITTSSTFKTLDDNKYWQYNGGTSYTIADFDEIPIPLTPTKRIPKFYVKRGMNPDGTWYEKISKTKHDETWLCHKAFISDDDGLEKPYIYVANEIITSTYRDLREDRGNFKVYGETEYDMFETLFRIAYASWMSTYDEDDILIIADLREFGIEYLDCVLRVDTQYEEGLGTSIDGIGFGSPFATYNGMSMRVSTITTFENVKGGSSLRVPENAPTDGAIYHFNEIEINGNDMFKYVSIVNEHDDANPVIKQSSNNDIGPDAFIPITYQILGNDIDLGLQLGLTGIDGGTVLFDIPLTFELELPEEGLDLYVGTDGTLAQLYNDCVNGVISSNDNYLVNNSPLPYMDSDDLDFPVFMFGELGVDEASFMLVDTTLIEMDLGIGLVKLSGVSIPNNNIVIQEVGETQLSLTLKDAEHRMRSGTFWQIIYMLTEEPGFLQKQDKFNPTLMDLQTYTKTNNNSWEDWNYVNVQQPNSVGIGTGMQSFLGYLQAILLFIELGARKHFLRTKYLNADFFAYDVLLYPVKTRLVMLP